MPAVTQMITGKSDREPGDFKFDPLGLEKDPAKLAVYKVNEIKNGRLAMIAVSGAIHHAAILNQNLLEQIESRNLLSKL
ncbi:light-harvest protein [Gracilaria domingensis]|nr:light-harvest protein [Gracilaria domingensis]